MRTPLRHPIRTVVLFGIFLAALVFLFHPEIGQFSLIINGEPVADPLSRWAAIPTLLLVLFFTIVLSLLLFIGVGVLVFLGAAFFAFFGLLVVAPYFWPLLLIVLITVALMAVESGGRK